MTSFNYRNYSHMTQEPLGDQDLREVERCPHPTLSGDQEKVGKRGMCLPHSLYHQSALVPSAEISSAGDLALEFDQAFCAPQDFSWLLWAEE